MINPIDLLIRAGVFPRIDETPTLYVDRGPRRSLGFYPGMVIHPGMFAPRDTDHLAMCHVEGRKPYDEALK